jgi:formate hydrogenlyase subunit 4
MSTPNLWRAFLAAFKNLRASSKYPKSPTWMMFAMPIFFAVGNTANLSQPVSA